MSPRVLLAGSLGFTLLFNVAWAWGTGWLSIVAAGACTLIVPAGLHLWRLVPAPTIWHRILRAFVMLGVCAAAIVTSFSHSVAVLLDAGWTEPTAWAVTGGMELLVALSTMALVGGQPVREQAGQGRTEQAEQVPAGQAEQVPGSVQVARPEPEPEPQRTEEPEPARTGARRLPTVPSIPDVDPVDDLRAWTADLGRTPTGYEVRQRYSCGHRRATRLLASLDDDEAAG